jgi:hypothetical protein
MHRCGLSAPHQPGESPRSWAFDTIALGSGNSAFQTCDHKPSNLLSPDRVMRLRGSPRLAQRAQCQRQQAAAAAAAKTMCVPWRTGRPSDAQ